MNKLPNTINLTEINEIRQEKEKKENQPIMMSTNDSFQSRVKSAINGKYRPAMHRSIQSLVLYEADRCLKDRYSSFKKPFQQKYALLATAIDLLKTLDFLDDSARQEIMFAGKEPLAPHQAWRRKGLITREMNQTFLPKAKELLGDEDNQERSHDEICEMLLQSMYEESSETTKPQRPPMWEFRHHHMFAIYRVYFHGIALDSDLFPPTSPRVVDVPDEKPADFSGAVTATLFEMTLAPGNKGENNAEVEQATPPTSVDVHVPDKKPADFSGAATLFEMALAPGNKGENNAEVASTPGNKGKNNAQVSIDQRKMLKELKQNIESFLNTFKGVIPDKELNQRKRVLFTQLRIGKLNGGAKDKKQQQQEEKEAKFAGADTGEVTEPPTTDGDWENVGTIDATKQQNKARRGRGEMKQQRKARREANQRKREASQRKREANQKKREANQRKRLLFTQLRIGKLNGGAKDKKQQQQEDKDKFTGADTGEVTEPPTTDDDWENVGTIDATKQQNKARREARREARRGRGEMKQQKMAEEKVVKTETMDEN